MSKQNLDWFEQHQHQAHNAINPWLKSFFQTALPQSGTLLKDTQLLALDFETTGLDAKKDEIISIGLVPFDMNRIYLKQSRSWLIKPKKKLNTDSVVIHGITHSDLEDAPDLNKILPEFLETIAGKICVVHYRQIERDFLNATFKRRFGEGIVFPVIDTLQIEWEQQRKISSGVWNRLKGKRPASVRLGASRTRYNLPAYTPHDALVDAIATAELLQAQVSHLYSDETLLEELWV
ncbi:3'-5' exonuclease [Vibrio gallicus]|uniref:3'-5' exonuclease n=1 Tax=Vibrio gallicus TaxID=190897 RepID=UPI0021C2A6C2|nr:3'-5' exonuclease [Vibrio gallicus]